MTDPRVDCEHAARVIGSISSIDELDGYEAQAKIRGIAQHEVTLILERRVSLDRRKGKRR